ncbi:hypothetical protein J6590_074709 [Homalodisca vitripennis]|nr:hypothetical protein J6590_074709 [Homalodisca vitripennis]
MSIRCKGFALSSSVDVFHQTNKTPSNYECDSFPVDDECVLFCAGHRDNVEPHNDLCRSTRVHVLVHNTALVFGSN